MFACGLSVELKNSAWKRRTYLVLNGSVDARRHDSEVVRNSSELIFDLVQLLALDFDARELLLDLL